MEGIDGVLVHAAPAVAGMAARGLVHRNEIGRPAHPRRICIAPAGAAEG